MTQVTNRQTLLEKVGRKWKSDPIFSTGLVLALMVILQTVALGLDYESFGAWFTNWGKNWINILRNNAGVGIVALGMTFVIISGGIDLAVGSTMVAIGAVIMVFINQYPDGLLTAIGITGVPAYAIGIVAGIIFGCLLGGISGVLIARSKLPAFIATLGMMKILRSVTQQVMQTAAVKVPSSFLAISNTKIGGEVILPILYWLVAAVILHIVSRYTPFGRHVYAVGSNERTARLSGVNVERVKGLIYVLMGALVAVTAVIQVSRIGSMDYANAGSGYEMDAIAAVVVGGTSMSGGRGSILGTVLGMLIIAVMNNLLNLMGVPLLARGVWGFIVIAAVLCKRRKLPPDGPPKKREEGEEHAQYRDYYRGKIAQVRHLPEYEQNPGARIAGLYDLNQERAQTLAAQYGAKVYPSLRGMLGVSGHRRGKRVLGQRQPCGNHGGGAGGRQACAVRKAHGHYAGGL